MGALKCANIGTMIVDYTLEGLPPSASAIDQSKETGVCVHFE